MIISIDRGKVFDKNKPPSMLKKKNSTNINRRKLPQPNKKYL